MLKRFAFLFSAFLFLQHEVNAAKVDTLNIFSQSMQKDIKCTIVLPENYGNQFFYSVVYLLHGYSGNYSSWLTIAPHIKKWVDENEVLVVCPDGGNSWYFNSPVDSSIRYETFISNEVIAYIDSNFKTVQSKKGRAIAGLSMGGHGALYLAIKHPNVFGAAGSMSGGVDFMPFPEKWEIKNVLGECITQEESWIAHTVIHQIENLKKGDLKILIDCGIDDFFIQVNRNLNEKLLEKNIAHDYIERPGGHTAEYWNNAVKFQLLFFLNYFNSNRSLGVESY